MMDGGEESPDASSDAHRLVCVAFECRDTAAFGEEMVFPIITSTGPGSPA